MKRVAVSIALVAVAVIALFSLFVALLPRDAVKEEIGQQIAGWTGRDVSLLGEPQIDIFPPLSVTLNDLKVSGPPDMEDADIISMDRLTGTIRLAPLMIGRVEVDSFVIERPVIRLIRDGEGRRNWAFDAGAAALQLAFAGDVPLGIFHLNGGTILFEDRVSGESERFDSVNLKVEWTSVRTPLTIEGSGIWRGEQVSLRLDAEAPFEFLSDAVTPVTARVESAPVSVVFAGEAEDYPLPKLNGSLKLSTSSLRRLASWLGNPIGSGSTLGQASLFGNAEFDGGVLSVSNAELTLDGNSASGALKITASAPPDVTGTLAFDSLDLSPYFAGLYASLEDSEDWRRVALPTEWFREFSADIRLSADSVKLGSLSAGSTAATASLKDARLEIGVARAALEGGALSGDLAVTGGDMPAAEAQLRVSDVDLETVGPAIGLVPTISGTGSAILDIASAGSDLGSLLDGLNGTARLEVRQGEVPSFGIAALAAEAGVSTSAAPMEHLSPVPTEMVSAGLSFSRGVAVLERGRLTTSSYVADAQGWIGLRDGTLGLNGTLKAAGADPESDAATAFAVEGTLDDPQPRQLLLAN